MTTKRLSRIAFQSIVAVCLTFGASVHAEDGHLANDSSNTDLDALDPEDLKADLVAELDDIFEEKTPPENKAQLISEFEQILHDDGDDDKEAVVTWAKLVQEMKEAGTNVHAVVTEAVDAAGEADSKQDSGRATANARRGSTPTLDPRADELSLGASTVQTAYNNLLAFLFEKITSSK